MVQCGYSGLVRRLGMKAEAPRIISLIVTVDRNIALLHSADMARLHLVSTSLAYVFPSGPFDLDLQFVVV